MPTPHQKAAAMIAQHGITRAAAIAQAIANGSSANAAYWRRVVGQVSSLGQTIEADYRREVANEA